MVGATVIITLPDGTRRCVVTDGDGRYAFAEVAPGTLPIEVSVDAETRKTTVDVLGVTASTDVPFTVARTTLAYTGTNSRAETALALVLVSLGSALLVTGRRLRRSAS